MDEQLVVKYIKTKNKVRKIVTYREYGELRRYHEAVVEYLNSNVSNSIFAKAYVPKSSIYKNAHAHMYNDIFLKMDIKDFFPSINHKKLAECLYFEINKKTSISRKECYDIVRKCSVGNKGLPLGLVSSPALANLYLKEFDGLLYGRIRNIGLNNLIYTRYADDMIISFKRVPNCEEKIEKVIDEVKYLLSRFHLVVNERKTQLFDLEKSNHVKITGVSITRDINNFRHISVGKKLKNEIFWMAINLYDQEVKDYSEIARLKGLYSFARSIEKQGIENVYSIQMKKLIVDRGYESLRELISSLGRQEDHKTNSI